MFIVILIIKTNKPIVLGPLLYTMCYANYILKDNNNTKICPYKIMICDASEDDVDITSSTRTVNGSDISSSSILVSFG